MPAGREIDLLHTEAEDVWDVAQAVRRTAKN
jgi:hypothetical protein